MIIASPIPRVGRAFRCAVAAIALCTTVALGVIAMSSLMVGDAVRIERHEVVIGTPGTANPATTTTTTTIRF